MNNANNDITDTATKAPKLCFSWMEFSGSLGDLGLFIPLVLAMTVASDLDIGLILICAGLMNIATGLLFNQPIPVQPMKAIAVVAITEQLQRDEIMAAGLLMGVFMLLFSTMVHRVDRLIHKNIIRGIQLGVGLKLATKGASYISELPWFGWDSILLAVMVAGFLLVMLYFKQPGVFFIFLIGFFFQYLGRDDSYAAISFSLPDFGIHWPQMAAWKNGLLKGAIPQFPLTVLNSVIAICALSSDYFPGRGISTQRMAASVGLMNLVSIPLGGIPMCHGSSGLAAQYHFGARTGGSVIMLGGLKIIVGLLFGTALLGLFQNYPMAILGPMLIFAGIVLAKAAQDILSNMHDFIIVIVIAVFILGINTLAGFAIGCLAVAASYIYRNTNILHFRR